MTIHSTIKEARLEGKKRSQRGEIIYICRCEFPVGIAVATEEEYIADEDTGEYLEYIESYNN